MTAAIPAEAHAIVVLIVILVALLGLYLTAALFYAMVMGDAWDRDMDRDA